MKKKTFGERCAEALEAHKKPCQKKRSGVEFCAVLQTVIAIASETRQRGFEIANGMDPKTGKWKQLLVYVAPKTSGYAVVTHCPFCGGKVE